MSDKTPLVSRDTMLTRIRRIRRKRRAIGAGIAALLVGAMVVTTASLPRPAGQTLGNAQHHYGVELFSVVFTDADHGYTIQRRCSMGAPGFGVREQCRTDLLATADGGDTWQERSLPDEAAIEAALMDPFWDNSAYHRSLMLWVTAPGTVAVGGLNLRYWATSDGGVSWQESPTPRPHVFQPGIITFFGPDDQPVTVKNPPAWQNETLGAIYGAVAATDGSFWVPGRSMAGVYYFTRDLGQTWQTATFPGAIDVRWVSTSDGQNVFAVYRDDTRDRLVRSTDSGATWDFVSGMPDTSLGGTRGLVLPNGDLLIMSVAEAGSLMRLKAGTTSAEHIAALPNGAHCNLLYETGGVVVAFGGMAAYNDPDLASAASFSTDNGATWVPIPVSQR